MTKQRLQEKKYNSEYDHYWHDYSAAIAGESAADFGTAMMKQSIGGTKNGEDADEEGKWVLKWTKKYT